MKAKPSNMDACFLPEPCEPEEADLYHRILAVHCHRKAEEGHACRGAVTIRRGSVTLQCPLCGDARKVIERQKSRRAVG